MRGKGITSRMCSVPQIHATVRSRPSPKAGVRNAAVAAQVEIPLKRFLGQVVLPDAPQENVVARLALAAADDFAVAFGRDHVEAERELGARGIPGHVKGLHTPSDSDG